MARRARRTFSASIWRLSCPTRCTFDVPERGEDDAPPAVSGGAAGGSKARLSTSTAASQAELEMLPRIGPVTAGRSLPTARRTAPSRIEDIEDGGPELAATFEGLRDRIRVE